MNRRNGNKNVEFLFYIDSPSSRTVALANSVAVISELDYDKAEATELAAFQFKQRTALLLATTSTSSLASWTHPSATSDNSNDRDDSFNYLPSSAHNVNTYKTSIARLKTIAAPSTETATKVSDRVKAARGEHQDRTGLFLALTIRVCQTLNRDWTRTTLLESKPAVSKASSTNSGSNDAGYIC